LDPFALGTWPEIHKYIGRQNQKDSPEDANTDLPRDIASEIQAPPGPTAFVATSPRMQQIIGIDSHQSFKNLETPALNRLNMECDIIAPD
jgi:hypothetical protein